LILVMMVILVPAEATTADVFAAASLGNYFFNSITVMSNAVIVT
jgi:hypothetical protein